MWERQVEKELWTRKWRAGWCQQEGVAFAKDIDRSGFWEQQLIHVPKQQHGYKMHVRATNLTSIEKP